MEQKKLYRSATDKKVCGVCGGLAEYFGCDSTIIRIIVALAMFFLGVIFGGLIVYFILALIMPVKPIEPPRTIVDVENKAEKKEEAEAPKAE
jgi:phage shock protein PspC (stress-responsive transcriptional regulator)